MKTYRFAREHNTHNEYTCDRLDDCTGLYVNALDLLEHLDEKVAKLEAQADTASSPELIAIDNRQAELKELIAEIELFIL